MPGSSVAVTALCPVWLPWVLPGLPRLRTGWNCSIPLFFSVGKEGRAAGRNFKHSATLSQAGISQEPDPECTQHVWSAAGNLGPSGAGMGARPSWKFWARCHLVTARLSAGWGPGRAARSAQLSSLPSTLELPVPQGRGTPALPGHCSFLHPGKAGPQPWNVMMLFKNVTDLLGSDDAL